MLSVKQLEEMQLEEIKNENQSSLDALSREDLAYIDDVTPTIVTCKLTKTTEVKAAV